MKEKFEDIIKKLSAESYRKIKSLEDRCERLQNLIKRHMEERARHLSEVQKLDELISYNKTTLAAVQEEIAEERAAVDWLSGACKQSAQEETTVKRDLKAVDVIMTVRDSWYQNDAAVCALDEVLEKLGVDVDPDELEENEPR